MKTRLIVLWITFFLLSSLALTSVFQRGEWDSAIFWSLRLPRWALAASVGAALSLSGALLQSLFGNPLCEPYTLGISSGAALGAVVAGSLGVGAQISGVSLPALLGGLSFTAIIALLAQQKKIGDWPLLLSGVMLSLLGSSLVALWMSFMDPAGITGAMSWLFGDLTRGTWAGALLLFSIVLFSLFFLRSRAQGLDALLLGSEDARTMGVPLDRLRLELIALTSILVSVAVSMAGIIGFVGLMIPHLCRRAVGTRHKRMLPIVTLAGAAFLTSADSLLVSILFPLEVPIGVVTALVGAPAFVWMLFKDPSPRGMGL
jgi:iron complex transport system permease protein